MSDEPTLPDRLAYLAANVSFIYNDTLMEAAEVLREADDIVAELRRIGVSPEHARLLELMDAIDGGTDE